MEVIGAGGQVTQECQCYILHEDLRCCEYPHVGIRGIDISEFL